jgi:TRAP-type C4-dicarboxylate transport system permease small subunit
MEAIKSVTDALDRFLRICDLVFLFLANSCLAVMVVGNAVNIFWRGVFDEAITLVWPWSMTLFVWGTFLGFFVLYYRRKDVAILVLTRALPAKYHRLLGVLVYLVIALLMGIIVATAPNRLMTQAGVIELVGMPRYVLSIPFFVSCLLIGLNSLVMVSRIARAEEAYVPAPIMEPL